MSPVGTLLARFGALAAMSASAHTLVNLRRLRVPPVAATLPVSVSVLLPLRDEAARAPACLAALRAARHLPCLQILVLDDESVDATAQLVTRAAELDPRVTLLSGAPLPAGWLGKPHACAQLATAATGQVLVFLDADVVLAPDGLARAVAALDGPGERVDLVSPYPRVLARGFGARLVQPLLQWSWLTFVPLRRLERTRHPALAAAGGQLLVVRAAAYQRAGGHAGVRTDILDDLALARAVIRSGGRIAMADGTALAECRMYESWAELVDGYTKSLWCAFGPPLSATAVLGGLALLYLAPWLELARRGGLLPLAGAAAGVAGRAAVARRTASPVWPDSLGQPLSVLALGWLTLRSHRGHRRGALRWRGRPV